MVTLLAKDDASKPRHEHSRLPFADGFFEGKRFYHISDCHPTMITACSCYVERRESSQSPSLARSVESSRKCDALQLLLAMNLRDQMSGKRCLDELPDFVLTEVFRRLCPVDRLVSICLVCKRWHRLVYEKNVWTDAIITIRKEARIDSKRTFLKKVSHWLKRLLVTTDEYTQFALVDLLPPSLPSLTFFEFSDFQEPPSRAAKGFMKFPEDFVFLDRCMPQLQSLIVNTSHANFGIDRIDLGIFNERKLFPHLQLLSLLLRPSPVMVVDMEGFLADRPHLEGLRICRYFYRRSNRSEEETGCSSSGNLKYLVLSAYVPGNEHHNQPPSELSLWRFRPESLVYLNLTRFTQIDVAALKLLHNLEHLHIRRQAEWGVNPIAVDYAELFQGSTDRFDFPRRLRYLALVDESQNLNEAVARLTRSCPELRALCLGPEDIGVTSVAAVAHSLRYLQVFQIRYLSSLLRVLQSSQCANETFPRLRRVSAWYFHLRDEGSRWAKKRLLPSLFALRPDLIVQVRERFLSYRWRHGKIKMNDDLRDDWRISEALRTEDGWCCLGCTDWGVPDLQPPTADNISASDP